MKNVLITGGSRGIGAEAVRQFRKNGDKVVFVYNSSDNAAQALEKESGAVKIKADVKNPAEVRAAVEKALDIMGGIDVLVANAGVSHISQICDVSDEEYRSVIDTNLGGVFFFCREVSKIMVRKHAGKIITVGSVWGDVGASCEALYSASKAGVKGLTKALSKELAPSGVTVNCVEPGVIDTEMNRHFSKEDLEEIVAEIPLGRMGTPQDAVNLICFLASDCADYITGAAIPVGGGFGY